MAALAVPPDGVDALMRRGVLSGASSGPSLAEVLRARVPLTDGEAATVAIPLAETLDEVHGAGLAYGPPTARDVVFVDGGRPVLAVPRAWSATPDDDVPGLLRLVLGAMAPALPPLDDEPGLDDEPDLRPVLGELLSSGCRSGAGVAQACFDAVCPEPVRLPDAGALARAEVLAPDGGTPPTRAPTVMPRPGAPRLPRRLVGPRTGTANAKPGPRLAGRRAQRRRARRRGRVRTALVTVALLVAAAALFAPPVAVRADGGPAQSPAGVVVDGLPDPVLDKAPDPVRDEVRDDVRDEVLDPVLDPDAPAAAAAALTRRRAAVLGAGDPAGLESVDARGGPARAADEDLLTSLGTDRLDGLSVDVQAADDVAGSGPGDVRVAVTSASSPYRRVGESGSVEVPGTTPRTVVLHLRWTDDGWRVWQVSDPAGAS
ncbi:MAG TPA: hypothetical protein VGC04_09665 [Cellulomonas sp.]